MSFLTCPCPLPCHSHTQHHSSDSLTTSHSDISSNNSLSSQPSLPSIPSLTPYQQPITTTLHRCIATLEGHSSYISALTLAGKHLYSASSNSEIRLWPKQPNNYSLNIPPTSNVIASTNTAAAVKSVLVLNDKLITAHQDHKIRVWKIDDNGIESGSQQQYKCISTLPTLNDRFAKLFSPKNYVEVRRHKTCTWVHHVDTVSALALSNDISLIYSASWDRTFKVWRTSDFKCLESVWNAHDDAINAIAVSGDGIVYTGSADRKIKVWKILNGEKKHTLIDTLDKHKSAVNALAISTDGSVLYSGACDRSIIVWEKDGGDGRMVVAGALRGHSKAILCITVVGEIVISGSTDKSVRIWKMKGVGCKSYDCVGVLEGHKGPVKCLTASLDSSDDVNEGEIDFNGGRNYLVYSGSLDCEVKVWNVWVPFLCFALL